MTGIPDTSTAIRWQDVAALTDLPALGGRLVVVPGGEIALLRNERDEIFAIDNRCPHKGGPLAEGAVSGHSVYCPLHNWRIDLTCGQACAPDVGQVRTWPVRVTDGRILIGLPL